MKKILLFILSLGFIVSASAQKRNKKEGFTTAQKTEIALKKMTLRLDLSERQQRKIRPLLAERIEKRTAQRKMYRANKEKRKNLTTEERYERKIARLNNRIAFKANMKEILNTKQYERFERSAAKRKRYAKRMIKKRRKIKHRRDRGEYHRDEMQMHRG